VLRDDGLAVAAQLGARGVALTVLTNSLHSTNAYYTASPLFFCLGPLAEAKLDLYAYSGAARPQTGTFPGSQRWGVHSKRAAIDDDTIMIGTDNVDPRSANRNSGLMVVCQGSPALAAPMNADLHERIRKLPHLSDRRQVELSGLF
jgi:putative cardiolipin synthase